MQKQTIVQKETKVSKLLDAVLNNKVENEVSMKTLSYSTDPHR